MPRNPNTSNVDLPVLFWHSHAWKWSYSRSWNLRKTAKFNQTRKTVIVMLLRLQLDESWCLAGIFLHKSSHWIWMNRNLSKGFFTLIGSGTGFRTEELILESFLSHWSDRSHHIGVRNRSHCRHHFTTLGCGIILSLWKWFSCHCSKATIASRTGTGTVRIFFSSWQFFAIGCCCKDTKRLPQLHPSTFHFIWGGWEESFWTTHHGRQLWWASTSSWSGTAGNCGGRASACPWGGTASTPANGREWIRPHGLPGLTGQSGDIAGKI